MKLASNGFAKGPYNPLGTYMNKPQTVLTIIGPWSGDATTSLMERCKSAWNVPLPELSDLMVATFLVQGIAVSEMLAEAERRLVSERRDDTEFFDDQLKEAVQNARKPSDLHK